LRWAVVVLVLLSGCAAQRPQTAEALRQSISGSKTLTFEVRRRHRDVAANLQRYAEKCLDKKAYKPTMVVSSRKAELHVVREGSDANEVPHYVLVADAWPVPRGRTSVQLFAHNGYDSLVAAVRAWASGKDVRCPDMTGSG
jgi:hypothetical protein